MFFLYPTQIKPVSVNVIYLKGTLLTAGMVLLPSGEQDTMCQNELGTIDELDNPQRADWLQQR